MDAGVLVVLLILGVVAILFWINSNTRQNREATVKEAGQEFIKFVDEIQRTKTIPTQEDPTFLTQPSEFIALCHSQAKMFEYRAARLTGMLGTRVKIGGIPLYLGGAKSRPTDELREVAEGTVYLTNQRLVFLGSARTYVSAIDDILKIENGVDWIRVQSGRRGKPVVFSVPNGFFWEGMFKFMIKVRPDSPRIADGPAPAELEDASAAPAPHIVRGKGKLLDP